MNTRFLIWSFEHRAWWGPNRCGYTEDIDLAGEYVLEEALEICARANMFHGRDPHEAIVPVPARRAA